MVSFLIYAFAAIVIALVGGGVLLALYTQKRSRALERRFPPVGTIIPINGVDTHFVDIPADDPNAPTVVFLHGASGNLRDPLSIFETRFTGKVRQIHVDRPGHGWSARRAGENLPSDQGDHIIKLLDHLEVDRAIFFGHSLSGVIIGHIGLAHPHRVAGLLFSAPVSHPWPGGINWYYHVAPVPILGWLFTRILTLPVGEKQIDCATDKVFWPNAITPNYRDDCGIDLILTPDRFATNSWDVATLRPFVVQQCKHYGKIIAPTTVITGDKDQVVLPWVHSDGLEEDIPHARVIRLKETGHMPHHAHADLFADEILRLAAGDTKRAAA